jgi:UDP-N-acetylmuramyl pentapeptide phosphotransferase/UDP-N-acetylglucosamine-1-phosphate transferase
LRSRSGGIAIVAAILLAEGLGAFLLSDSRWPSGLVSGFILVALVGVVEDWRGLPVAVRLAIHLIAGGLMVSSGLSLETLTIPGMEIEWPQALATTFTLLYVAWTINLYNFMDGSDGLAGLMAVIGFGTFAVLGYRLGTYDFALASACIAAAAAGFLVWNRPPARIFMGDTGSSVLGFLAAGFALWGSYLKTIPIWMSILIFAPFIADATLTLMLRTIAGNRVWHPHRRHFYQRLVLLGWSQRRLLYAEGGLMMVCSVLAMLAVEAPVPFRWATLGFSSMLLVGLAIVVARAERMRAFEETAAAPR